jgi:hypothetical protein
MNGTMLKSRRGGNMNGKDMRAREHAQEFTEGRISGKRRRSMGVPVTALLLLLLSGACLPVPVQPVKQDPLAGTGLDQAPAYPDLTIAIVNSENTKNAIAFGYQGSLYAGFDPQQIVGRLYDIFRRNFRTAVRIERVEDAAAIKPDLVAVLDVFVQSKASFRMDVSAIMLSPQKATIETLRSGGEKAFGMSGPGGAGRVIDSVSQDTVRALEQALRNSRALAAFAQDRSRAPAAAAAGPQDRRGSAPASDIDGPAFRPSERVFSDKDMAVVIGIERYQDLPASAYSANDARLVREYVLSLGIPDRNIQTLSNDRATLSGIKKTLETWLPNVVRKGGRVLVYYSGHGAPDPATGDAYLVPFDGDPGYLPDTGYSLKKLYSTLGRIPASEVVVVLDACFSGVGGRSVLAKGARPIVIVAEGAQISGNMAVLAATQGAQISTSSPERGHGILTYHFLKAIRSGRKDLAEIYAYLKPQVEDEARRMNVQQSPVLLPGPELVKGRFLLRK